MGNESTTERLAREARVLPAAEQLKLARAVCHELSFSRGHDMLCRGFDLIEQDLAEDDAAIARMMRITASCDLVNELAGQIGMVAAAGRIA